MTGVGATARAGRPLRLLLVEDLAPDADSIVHELERAGYAPIWHRVEDEAAYLAAIEHPLDIILSDYTLPQFSAMRALEILAERRSNVPLIVVTGTVGEETAADCIRRGAADYLLKDRMVRLASAVGQAMEHARLRDADRQAERAIAASQGRLDAIVNNALDAIFVTDHAGNHVEVNPAACELTGFRRDELLTKSVWDLTPSSDVERERASWQRFIMDGRASGERRIQRQDGTIADVEFRSVAHVFPNMHVFSWRDVSMRKQAEAEMNRLAYYDLLSGLPNRSLFLDRLQQALARTLRSQESVGVLFLDLDDFKIVNDSFGHGIGDRLLVAVAERLETAIRAGDTAARFGGDEFAVLLENVGEDGVARKTAERIVAEFQSPIVIDGHELWPTFSIGVAVSAPGDGTVEQMLRQADLAMYRAKANGKGQAVVFDEAMAKDARDRLMLEGDLRHALSREQFRIEYQPIVDLTNGQIVEVEALLRWQHSTIDLMPPAHFISVAEETGLIVPIGQWILEQACHQMRFWRAEIPSARELAICVNLSPRQFLHPQLVPDVARILSATGLEPNALKLEISEHGGMQQLTGAIATMQRLKALGVCLALDDFGTGSSSLPYLQRFPVDTLKIDRSFVDRFRQDDQAMAIVRTVIALARSLNLSATAEGIETVEQLTELRALGCPRGQGYFLARPAPSHVISTLLEEDRPLLGSAFTSDVNTAA